MTHDGAVLSVDAKQQLFAADGQRLGKQTKGKTMKLDEMTHAQRAAFGRRLFGRIGLPHNIGTRLLLKRIKGRAD